MKNGLMVGLKRLHKGFVWFLIITLLITMLPLAGIFFSNNPQGDTPDFLSAYTAHAASFPTSGYAGDNAKWSYNKKTYELMISGSGSMWNWQDPFDDSSEEIAPWLYYCDEIKTITIQSGIDHLGNYTFAACEAVTKVTIPNTVVTIAEGAFLDCCSLKEINLPSNLGSFGPHAFTYCDSLKTVTIPAKIYDLNSAFVDCMGLESIKVAAGNTTFKDIDGVVFSKNGKTLVSYPSGKKDHVYHVPDGVNRIGWNAFLYNSNIRAISFPEGITAIPNFAVQSNEKLLRIYLPASIKEIQWQAFTECPALTDVYYSGTEEEKTQITIDEDNDPIQKAEWHCNASPEDMLFALFEDVPKKAFYYQPVQWAAKNNVTSGTSDITFSPNNPCTRAQMVTFLWRAQGSPEPESMELPFTDLKAGGYYLKAVAWAVENNITKGVSDDKFGPDSNVSRAQTVTFLYRLNHLKDNIDDTSLDPLNDDPKPDISFIDVSEDAYYYKAVYWAAKNKITYGITPNTFEPNTVCSRGQIVTFLYRALEK